MTPGDVEVMLTLCFELIWTQYCFLKFDYTGQWDIAKSFDRVEHEAPYSGSYAPLGDNALKIPFTKNL